MPWFAGVGRGVEPEEGVLDGVGDLPGFVRGDPAVPVAAEVRGRQVVALGAPATWPRACRGRWRRARWGSGSAGAPSRCVLLFAATVARSAASTSAVRRENFFATESGIPYVPGKPPPLYFVDLAEPKSDSLLDIRRLEPPVEILPQVHDRAEFHRLVFLFLRIVGEVHHHQVQVPVRVRHVVLPGRPGLGALDGEGHEVARHPVFCLSALCTRVVAYPPGRPASRGRTSLDSASLDAGVAALQRDGDALGTEAVTSQPGIRSSMSLAAAPPGVRVGGCGSAA